MKTASSNLILPDVNVLLALAWPNHQFYAAATDFFESHAGPWATCAFTEAGFIRLSTNPAIVGTQRTPAEVAELLSEMTADSRHRYLASLPSPVAKSWKPLWQRIQGTKQVTDAYLLRLASQHGARFVTFDARLTALAPPSAIHVLRAKL